MLSTLPTDGDHQRGPGVLQPAEHAGRGQHEQQRGGAEEGDAQVRRRVVGDLGAGAEGADQRVGERDAERRWRPRRCSDREPEPVDALGERAAQVAGAEVAGDAAGGAVGEEDAQPHRRSGARRRRCRGRPARRCRGGRRWRRRRAGTAARRPAPGTRGGQAEDLAVRAGVPWTETTHVRGRGVNDPHVTSPHMPVEIFRVSVDGRSRRMSMSTNQLARPDDEQMNRVRRPAFSGAQVWKDVVAGQRGFPAAGTGVVHSSSPGRCTPRGRSSTGGPQLSPDPVDSRLSRGPRERLRSCLTRLVRRLSVPRKVRAGACAEPPVGAGP